MDETGSFLTLYIFLASDQEEIAGANFRNTHKADLCPMIAAANAVALMRGKQLAANGLGKRLG